MKPAFKIRLVRYVLLVAAVLSGAIWMNSCRNDEPAIPPLTGPSGHRLFITMEATPDHLLVVDGSRKPQVSHIAAQLKNQLGQGVPGEHIRLSIINTDGSVARIGSFDGSLTCNGGAQAECTTDSGGFVRADFLAPTSDQLPANLRVYVFALMTNPNYTFEVTDQHALDLQLGKPGNSGNCGPGGLDPLFTFAPVAPVVGQQVCFDASTTTTVHTVTSVKWDYGDGHGDISGTLNPCHTYSFAGIYNVTLTMQDVNTNRCSSTQGVPVTSGLPPVCGSIVQNPGGSVGIGVTYTFTSLATDPDSGIKNYSWNFGDGSRVVTSRSNSATHRYTSSGSFTILLTITDTQGNQTICTQAVTVTSAAPTCAFTATPSSGLGPLLVAFDASGSSDDGGFANLTFTWDFGDGGVGSGSAPSHTFTVTSPPPPNIFTVTLTVTDADGNATTCANSVTVN